MENNSVLKVTYLFSGLGAGVIVGVLFAPKSGEEFRTYLAKKADEGKEFSQRKTRELGQRTEDFIDAASRPQRDSRSPFPRRLTRAGELISGRSPKQDRRS